MLPDVVRHDEGVVFRDDVEPKPAMELYWHPDAEEPTPVVLWLHGGGWRKGSRHNVGPSLALLEHGFAVASVGYRLSQEACFPAQIEDCKAAVRFLRAQHARFGIDPERVGVWGSSAGGHLSALLATSGSLSAWDAVGPWPEQSSRVQAAVDWYGPTDFLRMNDHPGRIDHTAPDSPECQLVGGLLHERAEQVRLANPISHLDAQCPPLLIMHGSLDEHVLVEQGRLLHAACQAAGVASDYIELPDKAHGFKEHEDPAPIEPVVRFFQTHLGSG